MGYDFDFATYEMPAKPKRRRMRLILFLLLSILVQMAVFFGADRVLQTKDRLDLVPDNVTEIQARNLKLSPSPDTPKLMAISANRSQLAVVDDQALKIFDLKNGQELNSYELGESVPGAIMWLPDRNRLIFAVMNSKITSKVVEEPVYDSGTVKDETYSTDTYRPEVNYRTITKEGFEVSLYSLDTEQGSEPELIKTFWQNGEMPQQLDINLSTYTNLLYIHWVQDKRDYLVQIDIMKRIKDIDLPRGKMERLVVCPQSGDLYVDMMVDNSPAIYKYTKGRWRLQKYLDGYRLIGVTPDDQLAVAVDQAGQVGDVSLVNAKEELKPAWAFATPIPLKDVKILGDGRLIYFEQGRVIIHKAQTGEGTVFTTGQVDAYSADGKIVVNWHDSTGQLQVYEEVTTKGTPQ